MACVFVAASAQLTQDTQDAASVIVVVTVAAFVGLPTLPSNCITLDLSLARSLGLLVQLQLQQINQKLVAKGRP